MSDLVLATVTDESKVIVSVEENYIAVKNVGDSQVELVTESDPLYVSVQDQHVQYDANYIYIQSSASNSWSITHNLGKFCSVTVVDSNDEIIYGNIVYNSANQLTITFNAQITGKAYLN